jgi:hypothetical protein
VMTQVDLALTNVSRFDSTHLVIRVNDANLKTWGVTQNLLGFGVAMLGVRGYAPEEQRANRISLAAR